LSPFPSIIETLEWPKHGLAWPNTHSQCAPHHWPFCSPPSSSFPSSPPSSSEPSCYVFITSFQVRVELKGPVLPFYCRPCVLAVCPTVQVDQWCLDRQRERGRVCTLLCTVCIYIHTIDRLPYLIHNLVMIICPFIFRLYYVKNILCVC